MNTRILTTPEEIVEAIHNGEKIEINGGVYWRIAYPNEHEDYWHHVLLEYKVRATPQNVAVNARTLSWGWIIFWIAIISYVSFHSGVQLARKNVKADTAHIRDVCFNLYRDDNRCIEDALKRIEESTP